MTDVLFLVKQERARQDAKWGVQRHSYTDWIAILGEEFGEASKEAVEYRFGYGVPISPESHEIEEVQIERLKRLKTELIQTAAVAVAIVEQIDEQLENL